MLEADTRLITERTELHKPTSNGTKDLLATGWRTLLLKALPQLKSLWESHTWSRVGPGLIGLCHGMGVQPFTMGHHSTPLHLL